ncbi:MAG: transglycosylase domain-containing protein, partial [Clostridia bacterium]|nr:transglycosylase domain-containing protein [Clostridia bacterium]
MKKVLKISLIILLTLFVISLAISITFITIVKKEISQISIDKELLLNQTTQIMVYDNENNIISNSNYEGKKLVNIGEIPEYVKQAFISIEDKNFYNHNGVNYKRILKALYNNIKSHKIVEGASTITQQLVKNTHLTTEKTFKRKIKEIYLAKKIEDAYSKDEILELYLNVIYFGNGNYGIENASNYYFGVSASELTINQAAVLAGMIKSPKNYDPLNNCENCKKRRNLVLKEMLKDGKITNDIYQESINKEIKVVDNKDSIDNNSQYVKASISEACKILNTTEQNIAFNNYKIFTYYDDDVQSTLVETINNNDYYEKNEHGNIADGLGIVINNNTGGIEAFAGKSNYNLSNVKRQPGSAIKPILVYAPALDNGTISPMTQLLDESINIDGYTPHNVGGDNHG